MNLHVVDGTYELFRHYFGAPPSQAPDGQEVGAVRGFMRTLLSLVKQDDCTHVGVAFDHTIESFRNELFDGYKTGEGMDPVLFAQFPLAERAAAALGFAVWPMVDFEADDALATAAARFKEEEEVDRIFICTPDKDLAQCVDGDRVVCVDRRRKKTFDRDGVFEKFSVWPESIPDYLALVGDSADGIPGVPRWGAKSAGAVLARYKHLEEIPTNPGAWDVKVRSAKTLAENLQSMRAEALLYRRLATLRTDAPVAHELHELEWRGPTDDLVPFCEAIGETRIPARFE